MDNTPINTENAADGKDPVRSAGIVRCLLNMAIAAKKKIAWRRIGVGESMFLTAMTVAAAAVFGVIEHQFVGDTIFERGSETQIAVTLTALSIVAIMLRVMIGRLHDMGRTSLYLLVLLALLPLAVYTTGTPLSDAPLIVLVIVVLTVVIMPGNKGPNRYGDVPRAIRPKSIGIDLLASSVILLAVGSVASYTAFAGDEIYVGRNKYHLSDIVTDNTIEGDVITQCYGFRGVTAYQDDGRGTFARDGYEKGTFLFILKPDNSIDIVFHGPHGTTSYQEDGFNVRYQGLSLHELQDDRDRGAGFVSYKVDLSNLLVAATSKNSDEKIVSMVQFSFGSYPNGHSYADTRALMTQTTRSASLLDGKMSVRGRIMIGNCDSRISIIRESSAAIPIADLP